MPLYFRRKDWIMETIQVSLNRNIVESATIYARHKGMELSTMIEEYLMRTIPTKKEEKTEIPDIVLSLLGAGTPVEADDLNGRKAYYSHLEEKYQ